MDLTRLYEIFSETKQDVQTFIGMLEPKVENARTDHERLYFHHILEEEEHHDERLQEFVPKLSRLSGEDISSDNWEFISLLQDLSLEKFGLHNFLEHLDLFMYEFDNEEEKRVVQSMRDRAFANYQAVKELAAGLKELAGAAAEKPSRIDDHITAETSVPVIALDQPVVESAPNKADVPQKKGLTVGSLKMRR